MLRGCVTVKSQVSSSNGNNARLPQNRAVSSRLCAIVRLQATCRALGQAEKLPSCMAEALVAVGACVRKVCLSHSRLSLVPAAAARSCHRGGGHQRTPAAINGHVRAAARRDATTTHSSNLALWIFPKLGQGPRSSPRSTTSPRSVKNKHLPSRSNGKAVSSLARPAGSSVNHSVQRS